MKVFEATFEKKYNGRVAMMNPVLMERMTPEMYHQVRGCKAVTPEELSAAGIKDLPYGFNVWRTKHGDLRAVKIEHI